jgi:hypothetical protein
VAWREGGLVNVLYRHFEEDILALFKHALTSTYFSFSGQSYEHTDGVSMGSPLSPIITKFLMKDFKDRVLEQVTGKPLFWFCYVDGTFVIWPYGLENLERLLDHLNGFHRNIHSSWR